MALVADGYSLVVQFVDSGDNVTTRTYALTSTTPAGAATDALALITDLLAVTTAAIRGYTIGQRFIEDAFSFPLDVEIEDCAEISAYIVGHPGKSASVNIPAPNIGIFVGSTGKNRNIVDTTDAAVQAFLSNFGNTGVATLSDGEIINPTTASGKRIHKKSRRG